MDLGVFQIGLYFHFSPGELHLVVTMPAFVRFGFLSDVCRASYSGLERTNPVCLSAALESEMRVAA